MPPSRGPVLVEPLEIVRSVPFGLPSQRHRTLALAPSVMGAEQPQHPAGVALEEEREEQENAGDPELVIPLTLLEEMSSFLYVL